MTYQAVLFDLDGTLLDTLDDLADSMNAALAALGFPGHPTEAYKYMVGDGLDVLARRVLAKEHHDPETLERCVAGMREQYGKRWLDKTRPYDGIPELLDALTERNIKMAVLSNKPDDFTRSLVSRLLAKWRFEAVVGVQPGVPKKPDPTAALQVADQMKLLPQQFLYLGDTNTDMKTARAADMYPVGALWGFRTAEELLENGAKTIIEKPIDLLDLL